MQLKNPNTDIESILNGHLEGAEIVIGLVGAVGVDLKCIVKDLVKCLGKYKYNSQEIHVSRLINDFSTIPPHDKGDEFQRIDAYMTAGDEARDRTEENAILALAVTRLIYGMRKKEKVTARPKQAYIVNSLKHPDEVNALRRIYGNGFYLLGVFVEPLKRKHLLTRIKGMTDDEAEILMHRDEAEEPYYGQRTRDTFHLSDFFVHLLDGDDREIQKTQVTIERFLDIIFADPYKTPLFDEYAMFMAFAAATSSADLSRQIGAVITRGEEIIASGANECPRFGGGPYWPYLDNGGHVIDVEGGRDYKRGYDPNDNEKIRIIKDAIDWMKNILDKNRKTHLSGQEWNLLKDALASSTIDDITEYGRSVHAEMAALLTCARNNISCRGATLYTTTFPCHNCAKHIIAAGIDRIVYVEPYPKSKALDFHRDSAFAGFKSDRPGERKVAFEPFVGVGARRFIDLFSMKQGSGFPLSRKCKSTGKTLQWNPENGIIRTPELPWSYLEREVLVTDFLNHYLEDKE